MRDNNYTTFLQKHSEQWFENICKEYTNVINFFKLPKNEVLIDLGCGQGHLLKVLKDNNFTNFYGLDFDCKILKNNFVKDRVLNGNIIKLPFKNNSISNIIIMGTLHHLNSIDEYKICLVECERILKKDGMLYIYEPANTIIRKISAFFLMSPISNLFTYSKNMRKLVEIEWQEYNYWLKNLENFYKIISDLNFQIILKKEKLTKLYIILKKG
ncbi:MAG TPA: class I SAM-dependent methyltransferase [bacterium]|nr:class I SAM-dependent methyltransferase [bacterium]